MFEKEKSYYLFKKFNILAEQQLKLIREGKLDEADKITQQLEDISAKMEKVASKTIDKGNKKADKLIARMDEEISSSTLFDDVELIDEEFDRVVSSHMK